MIIYRCTSCRYTFRYPVLPSACPDCGRRTVRPADRRERQEYRRNQKILIREIRQGLYNAAG